MSKDTSTALVSEADLKAFEDKQKEIAEAKMPAMYNHIRISYEDDDTKGKFVSFKQGDTKPTVIGDDFKATVLGVFHQYIQFKDESEGIVDSYKTTQFTEFQDPVNVYKNGVMHQEAVTAIAEYRKEVFPNSTYFSHLYMFYKGEVFLYKVKGTACSGWFDYKKYISGRVFWQMETNFGLLKQKSPKGATYWIPTFKEGILHGNKEYQDMLRKSFEVSKMVEGLNYPAGKDENPNATEEEKEIKAEDLPF